MKGIINRTAVLFFALHCCLLSNAQNDYLFQVKGKESCDYTDIYSLDLKNPVTKKALIAAGDYLSTMISPQIIRKNFYLSYCESEKQSYKISNSIYEKRYEAKYDTLYNLFFVVTYRNISIGSVFLSVNAKGKPVVFDYEVSSSDPPEKIAAFRSFFDGSLKVSWEQAVSIARKKGFKSNPALTAGTVNKVIRNGKDVYVKIHCTWKFDELRNRVQSLLVINAETGKIEQEAYIPPMPK